MRFFRKLFEIFLMFCTKLAPLGMTQLGPLESAWTSLPTAVSTTLWQHLRLDFCGSRPALLSELPL